jgi:hypothetical protein
MYVKARYKSNKAYIMKYVLVFILLMLVITACSSSSDVKVVQHLTAVAATDTPTSAHPTLWYYKKGVIYQFVHV